MAGRLAAERRVDTLAALAREIDAWVASASATGDAYLIPLSYHWNGEHLTFATPPASRTARNLRRAGRARVALPSTEDVVLIEGPVEVLALDAEPGLADAFADRVRWDPRDEPNEYVFLRVRLWNVRAWRNVEELEGREIMKGGVWLG